MRRDNIDPSNAIAGGHAGRSSLGQSIALLAIATVLLMFSNGRYTIPIAAWLAPLALLRFTRLTRPVRGLLVAWLILSATWAFQLWGMVPVPVIFYCALAAIYGLMLVLPFVADRLLTPSIGGFAGTLVLPLAWVVMEFVQATTTPYGSWGAAVYTQHENLVLLQIVSITGLYGVGFLIAWAASVGNWLIDADWELGATRRGATIFAVVLIAVLTFGYLTALLGFHAECGHGARFEALESDCLTGFFAVAVAAVVHARYGLVDLLQQLALAVAGAQLEPEL